MGGGDRRGRDHRDGGHGPAVVRGHLSHRGHPLGDGEQGGAPRHPAVAVLGGQAGRARGGPAVPERHRGARLGLDGDAVEGVDVVAVGDPVLGEQAAQDVGVGPHQAHPVHPGHVDHVELVVEGAGPEAQHHPVAHQRAQGADADGGVHRMAERDQRAGAQGDVLGDRADGGEGGERLVEGDVGRLHLGVGLEHQVVAHPQGVEAEALGQHRAVEHGPAAGVPAEMGHQQPELHVGCVGHCVLQVIVTAGEPTSQNWQRGAPHRGQNAANSPPRPETRVNWQRQTPHRGQNAANSVSQRPGSQRGAGVAAPAGLAHHLAVHVHVAAPHHGAMDAALGDPAVIGGPAALRQHGVGRVAGRIRRVEDHDVGVVAGAQEALGGQLELPRGLLGHHLGHPGQRDQPVHRAVQQHRVLLLDAGGAGVAGPAVLPADLLLGPGVGGVVRREHVDGAVVEGPPDGLSVVVGHPVRQGVGAELLDVGPARQEQRPVVDLAAHRHAPLLGPAHQLHRPLGLHVNDVELGAGGLGHLQDHCDGGVPDQAVVSGQSLGVGGGAAVAPVPVGLLGDVHDGLVVGVDHERQPGGADGLEHAQQVPVVLDAGAAGMGVVPAGVDHHVDLEGGHPGVGHGLHLGQHAGHRVVVPVDDALGVVEVEQLLEDLAGLGDRVEVGHPEHGGHSPGGGRGGAGADVLLVDVAGLAQVHVHVDHARQHPLAGRVDALNPLGQRHGAGGGDGRDLLARDEHVGRLGARSRHHGPTGHDPVDGRRAESHQRAGTGTVISGASTGDGLYTDGSQGPQPHRIRTMTEPALPFETFMGQHKPLGDLIGQIDESVWERSAVSPVLKERARITSAESLGCDY